MKVTLVGFKTLDFTTKEGDRVQGISIYYAYPDANVTGNACDNTFIQASVYDSFGVKEKQLAEKIGEVIDLEFGRRGKIVGISVT